MILFILYVILSSSGIILFKLGSTAVEFTLTDKIVGFNMSYTSLLGLLCYLISFVLWMVIIGKNDVSYIVPIGLAATNVTIMLGATFFLGEAFSLYKIIGLGLILGGIVFLNLGNA